MVKEFKPKRQRLFFRWATGNVDITFLLIVLTLCTIGLIMLFSAGYAYSFYKYKSSTYFIRHQAIYAAIGIAAMVFVSRLDFNTYRAWGLFVVGISLVLLILVLLQHKDDEGFKRWIKIGNLISFQPSEIAKVGVIMFFAWACEKWQQRLKHDIKIQLLFIAIAMMFAFLVFIENHLSGAILMALLSVIMLFIGGLNRWWFIALLAVGALAVFVLLAKPDLLKDYMGERITAWRDKSFQPTGARWQINQSLNAIGSGGLLGQGLGESKQKYMYVSEPQNDFIFAIVCEELGFVGAVFILLLFALLVWRGFVIAMRCRSRYGAAIALGIVFQIGLQTVLNLLVVTDTVPNTGISLPFFSYGGTSLVVLLAEMGMVLSISRYSDMSK